MYQKSFLKWPGGKYRALPRLLAAFPRGARFVEPFVGSGTVFLNTDYREYLLCDANPDLIGVFRLLRREPEAFIRRCKALFTPASNTAERYYELRAAFNNASSLRERAALFIYCNRHGYNGLVRYNAQGGYNVPFGRYAAPHFPEAEMRAFSAKCRSCAVEFAAQDFSATFARLRTGDVVYADPPYVPLSRTASFTAYAGLDFGMEQQCALAEAARQAAARGIPVILSNHDTADTRRLYAGAALLSFPVRRSISCNGAARGDAAELLAVFS
ncbi:MAG: Dam family site-specific DNA-(adenine-N6)-methyltransferase [Desulfovibrionaceae bacterium]|nr:Dam family site-specific DNA-(adenine-N6)-methyltransferase [Desulfovibrionaceae bacterium]